MRWYVNHFTDEIVVSVLLAFATPLCANCGLQFDSTPFSSSNGAGAPRRWCIPCEEEMSRLRKARRAAIRQGFAIYADRKLPAVLTLAQKKDSIELAEIDGSKIYGLRVIKRCGNPHCKKPSYCAGRLEEKGHASDNSCHQPAWIDGLRRKYCSESCRKIVERGRKSTPLGNENWGIEELENESNLRDSGD